MAKLTRDVMVLSTGFTGRAGTSVGRGEVPASLWRAWVLDGIVADDVPLPPPATPEPEKEIEGAALPHSAAPLAKVDKQLDLMSDDELRKLARSLKITSWHLMKRDKLIQRIEEQS